MTLETKARELAEKCLKHLQWLHDGTPWHYTERWVPEVIAFAETIARDARDAALEESAILVGNWRPQSRTIGQIYEDEQKAAAIRALRTQPAALAEDK